MKAHQNRINEQIQLAWINGLYVKKALESTIVMCGLADNKTQRNMSKYPEFPQNQQEIDEEQIKKKRELLIAKMNYWTRENNKRFKK